MTSNFTYLHCLCLEPVHLRTGTKSHLLEALADSLLSKMMPLKCRPGDAIIVPNVLLLRQEIHIGHPRSIVPRRQRQLQTPYFVLKDRVGLWHPMGRASSTPCSASLICPKTPRVSRKPGSTRSPLREPCPILLSFALCRTCQARCQSRCCLIAWRRARLAGFHAASDFTDLCGVC